MKKPASLREHLSKNIPGLMTDPENFIVFITNGNWRVKRGKSLSFTFTYDLLMLFKDFSLDPAIVFAHLIEWLEINQHELISNPDKLFDGMSFEVEPITHETADILITLKLTEDVIVQRENGVLVTEYKPEPDNQWIHDRIKELGLKSG